MADWKLKLYHQAPLVTRHIIASLRGYYLQSRRYGKETEQLVAEILDREHWLPEQWKIYQENRLAYILHRAATQVPYYRDLWAKRRQKGDQSAWDDLGNWTILEKEQLRQTPLAFVADDCNPKQMFHEHTSGTTGKSLDLWWSQHTVRTWYAFFEARWRRWYGLTRHDRWGIMGGQLVTPAEQTKPPFWVWNQGMNQLYLSSYHLAPQFLTSYLDALQHYNIQYLYGYTSALYLLAQEILKRDAQGLLNIKVVLTNAEPLYTHQREVIAQAFRCPVRETYGMAEIVSAASECEAQQLHTWPEIGYIELAEQSQILASEDSGELICTGLLNQDMPLIRYRVGDRAQLNRTTMTCTCGRHLPRLIQIEGRQDDLLYTPDGRPVGRLDPVFKAALPISEAQIIQETIHRVRVLIVPDTDYTEADGLSIVKRLQDRMGSEVRIELEKVTLIPRSSNGKFRAVVSNLSAEERAKVQDHE